MPGPPSAPRVVVVDDTTGNPIFGTGAAGSVGANPPGAVSTNPSHVSIDAATIAVPVDVQSLYRTQVVLTNAVLAASASYTSAAIDALNFRRITGRAISDVAGTAFAVQQSDDNVTWDNLYVVTPGAGTMTAFDIVIYLRYVRLNYVNAAGAQTSFRLSGYLAAA